jgi:hypothetical protein
MWSIYLHIVVFPCLELNLRWVLPQEEDRALENFYRLPHPRLSLPYHMEVIHVGSLITWN